MLPNMNPKQMEALLRQMGIKTTQLKAKKVIIELDDSNYIIEEPVVIEISAKGKKSFQIEGEVKVEIPIKEEDVKLVMEQTGCSEEEAKKALKEKGDLAEAILYLKGE